ncbi:MAG: hypothetical protein E6L04_07685 [Thaumarchaeota archaeon]|nr:MAG: hypothetical protein E6L04_07685 [Nitrososphaerota archaeon]
MLLSYNKQIKNIEDVKEQISKIILNQRRQIESNLKTSVAEIQYLLSEISEFNDNWTKLPTVYRIAWISSPEYETTKNITFKENIELPNVDHDLELVIKLLNHMRERKNLKVSKMPLFIHPDEISIAYREGRFPYERTNIISQIVVVFQKGKIKYVGIVFDRNYVLLQNRLIDLFR